MIDCPEEAKRVLDEIAATYPVIFEDIYEAGDMKERGCIGWPPTYCEGKCAVVCCDYSCLLSPAMGKEFFLPYVEQEAAYLDRSVYHLDGKDALCHLDNLLAIEKLDVFQWVPGDGQPAPCIGWNFYRRFKRPAEAFGSMTGVLRRSKPTLKNWILEKWCSAPGRSQKTRRRNCWNI